MLTEADIFELLDIHAVDGAFAALDRKLNTTKATPRAKSRRDPLFETNWPPDHPNRRRPHATDVCHVEYA